MSDVEVIPELKQIIGAILFAAKEPVSLAHLRQVFVHTAEQHGGITKDFAEVGEDLLKEAIAQLNDELSSRAVGIHVREVANGYRLVNDANCGLWLRVLLEKGKANRLSRPALETLAIIAYRQPAVRSEIEAVRGVAVDQIIRNLLDLQLIRVVGRSDLPGRPWLFGTTQKFLEHFGIKSLNDLPGTDELRRLEAEQIKRREQDRKADAATQTELPIGGEGGVEDGRQTTPAVDDPFADDPGSGEEDGADDGMAPRDDEFDEDEDEDEYEDDEDDEDEDGDDAEDTADRESR